MIENKYRVSELVKYNYSDIGEHIDENHTDRPLRNDEIVKLLNNQEEKIIELESQIKQLQKQYQVIEEQYSRIEELRWSNKLLRANRKTCEQDRIRDRKNWESMDKMRVGHIRFLQKRLKENGLSIYIND